MLFRRAIFRHWHSIKGEFDGGLPPREFLCVAINILFRGGVCVGGWGGVEMISIDVRNIFYDLRLLMGDMRSIIADVSKNTST